VLIVTVYFDYSNTVPNSAVTMRRSVNQTNVLSTDAYSSKSNEDPEQANDLSRVNYSFGPRPDTRRPTDRRPMAIAWYFVYSGHWDWEIV